MVSCSLSQSLKALVAALGGIVLGIGSITTLAEEFSRGQALYENHCQSCHTDWAHTRSERKVTSMGELHRRVAAWSIHSGLDWSDEDIGDVADYLEQNFYRFETKP
jgi:mono/diheme cytochrome c family protein